MSTHMYNLALFFYSGTGNACVHEFSIMVTWIMLLSVIIKKKKTWATYFP